jgi:mannose-6-phosphate isomerase-like protein (cupin superfamily)
MNVQIIKQDELPFSTLAHEFIGADHEGVGASIIFVDAEPGRGPRLHKHPYEEILIILEGSARLVVGDRQLSAGEGEIVIVPPETPHSFTSAGSGPLRQIDIHVSPTFITDWL